MTTISIAFCPMFPKYFFAYPGSWCFVFVFRVTSPRARFVNVMIAPIRMSQNVPIRSPDFAKT